MNQVNHLIILLDLKDLLRLSNLVSMWVRRMSTARETVMAFKYGKTPSFMKVIGKRTNKTVGDACFILMVMCTLENGRITKLMDTVRAST